MATTEVEVYNMALAGLGTFSSLEATTDRRREAELCNIWFPTVRDRILRCAPWPGAYAVRRLASVATRDDTLDWTAADPAPGWLYAHGVPNDFLWPRHFSTYQKFFLSSVGDTPVIASNVETPILVYTKKQTNVAAWDPDLTRAIAFDLAAHIVRGLEGSEVDQLRMMQMAEGIILQARATASNMLQEQIVASNPEWIAARGFSAAPAIPYLYPSAEYMTSGFNNLG